MDEVSEVIVQHPEFIGLGATVALQKALKRGMHVQFGGAYTATPGRLYLELNEGVVQGAFEIRPTKSTKEKAV